MEFFLNLYFSRIRIFYSKISIWRTSRKFSSKIVNSFHVFSKRITFGRIQLMAVTVTPHLDQVWNWPDISSTKRDGSTCGDLFCPRFHSWISPCLTNVIDVTDSSWISPCLTNVIDVTDSTIKFEQNSISCGKFVFVCSIIFWIATIVTLEFEYWKHYGFIIEFWRTAKFEDDTKCE
jgi:hypothetical protein